MVSQKIIGLLRQITRACDPAFRHRAVTSLRQFARLVHRASCRRVFLKWDRAGYPGRAGGGDHELPAAAR